ncbi:MAG TPA: JAB domain-containing protein [Bacteroidales bacterium]|nr:JAB domain-containing protein [Bacteroidales bacterium]HPI84886.1 JAB domain-containing protein [Bacteroidales bacterium]
MKAKNPVTLFTSNLSEIEIFYRNKVRSSDMEKVCGSRDTYEVLMRIWSSKIDHVEEFMVLCLNRANRVLGWAKISQGGLSGTVADPKVIFQVALKSNSSSMILAHNHPSGNLHPSEADIQLTRKMKEAGILLDLPVLDHIIISSEGYYSFADEGLL